MSRAGEIRCNNPATPEASFLALDLSDRRSDRIPQDRFAATARPCRSGAASVA